LKFDTVVLGAGIIGVSVAIHLQQRGRLVALVDLKTPGSETSAGNAGLIQCEGVYPYAFPRNIFSLLKYALNRSPDVRYQPSALLKQMPFLWKYWFYSQSLRHTAIARAYATLIQNSLQEHHFLADAAGVRHLFRPGGWIKAFRTHKKQDRELQFAKRCKDEFGVQFEFLNADALHQMQSELDPGLIGALRFIESEAVSDPEALVLAYAHYFKQLGGQLFCGDARTLSNQWTVQTEQGTLNADSAVIALGPWSDILSSRLGYNFPLAVKRGYHMHYGVKNNVSLNYPILDFENGYILAPMARGIRLTTGAEFASRDGKRTPIQIDRVEPIAHKLFPIAQRLDDVPWMGCRPCTPDMLPIIDKAPLHQDLWFAFGHGHHGLTLGPITGRLLAEMMTGQDLIVDPLPFSAARFLPNY
jgi:D-amino-acid dehydrogenase